MVNLAKYLHQFVRESSGSTQHLEKELKAIEARKFDIEKKLESARLALHRADTFIPASGLDTYCPRCWILDEKHSRVTPIPSKDSRVDLFKCEGCGYQYEANF